MDSLYTAAEMTKEIQHVAYGYIIIVLLVILFIGFIFKYVKRIEKEHNGS